MSQGRIIGDARAPAHRTFVRGALIASCLAASAPEAPAQLAPSHRPIRFLRSEVEPFLPQSSVYTMLQDRHGYLWFGTREGLGRWDGYEMRVWKARPFASDALPDNVVRQVVEDGEGHLWVVAVADNFESMRVARLVAPRYDRVQTIPVVDARPAVDGNGRAWIVGRDSVYRFDAAVDRLEPVRPRLRPGDAAAGAFFDRSGTLWIGTSGGWLERYHLPDGDGVAISYPWAEAADTRFLEFLEDAQGTIWIGGSGLRRLNPARDRVEAVPGMPAVLDTVVVGELVQDPDGWIWAGTLDGVYRFDPALTRVERHSMALPGNVNTQNWITALLRDRAGAIWVGTVWGLHRYDPVAETFTLLHHDPQDPASLSSGIVLPIVEDSSGAIWAGTLGGGLNRIDPHTGRVRRFRAEPGGRAGLPHDWIWGLAVAHDGRVLVGTERGMAIVDASRAQPVRHVPLDMPPGIPSGGVHSFLPDANGGAWVGTAGWLLYLDRAGRSRPAELPFIGTMHTILRDGPSLWIGTSVGLIRYEPGTGRHEWHRHRPDDPTSLSHDFVLALHLDRQRRLWIGTNSGLNRLDPGAGGFVGYRDEPDFPEPAIHSILEDDAGRLWFGTNRGLLRFDPAAAPGNRIRRYGTSSGIGNVEFNRGAGLRGRDGTFYFGGDRGLTVFHPVDLLDNPFVPPVVISAVQVAGSGGVRELADLPADRPLVLAPDDYTLTVTFAALSFTHPDRNQYSWRLEGVDPQWSPAGTVRTATYTKLRPGRYTLRVRASNSDGVWNEEGIAMPVVVEPWFWETWWFRSGLALVAIGIVSVGTAVVQRGRHRRELAAVRYRQALEAERARISRDMHDEVGAGLTEIAMLSEVALRRPAADGVGPAMAAVAGKARAMLDAIGEIIWAINPDHDRAERVTPYLREYTADFLENAGLEAVVRFDTAEWTGMVSADLRRHLFLILKEALANVARHAGARRVEVKLVVRGGGLRLVVADDGRGFGRGDVADGAARGRHGLINLHRRAQAIGGTLEVVSAPGEGTRLILVIPALPGGIIPGAEGPA